jgi:hypothetical protein
MPKPREAALTNCSFCGQDKDDVPLLVTSTQTKAACCSWCALGITEQTYRHMVEMQEIIRQARRTPVPVPETGEPDVSVIVKP